jgi:hypothetical protein
MDIQRKAFEESNNVNPDWSFKFDEELQQYVAVDFEMTNQVDEFNDHWDTFRAGWDAKAQAVPDGFVVVNQKDLLELTIAINAVDLATHTESKTNEVREMWQQVALKLMALGTAQEPTND